MFLSIIIGNSSCGVEVDEVNSKGILQHVLSHKNLICPQTILAVVIWYLVVNSPNNVTYDDNGMFVSLGNCYSSCLGLQLRRSPGRGLQCCVGFSLPRRIRNSAGAQSVCLHSGG